MSGTRSFVGVAGPGVASGVIEHMAEEVGRGLARCGAVVVCGGLGGAMEAACRGAKSEGGLTVGILPGKDRSDANEWVDVAVPTGLGEMRNALIVRACDALIAVGGGYGTLSEVALALRSGLCVVGLATWRMLSAEGAEDGGLTRVETPEEAVAQAVSGARRY